MKSASSILVWFVVLVLGAGLFMLRAPDSTPPAPSPEASSGSPTTRPENSTEPPPVAHAPAPHTNLDPPVSTADPSPIPAPLASTTVRPKWLDEPGLGRSYAVSDPRSDGELLAEASEKRNSNNPWKEDSFVPIRRTRFDVTLTPLSAPDRQIQFELRLRRGDPPYAVFPDSIREAPTDSNPKPSVQNYRKFVSLYSSEEVYIGLLAFPVDAFWKKLEGTSGCAEVALIYDGLVASPNAGSLSGFTGRVFCRKSLRDLRGIAHISAAIKKRGGNLGDLTSP